MPAESWPVPLACRASLQCSVYNINLRRHLEAAPGQRVVPLAGYKHFCPLERPFANKQRPPISVACISACLWHCPDVRWPRARQRARQAGLQLVKAKRWHEKFAPTVGRPEAGLAPRLVCKQPLSCSADEKASDTNKEEEEEETSSGMMLTRGRRQTERERERESCIVSATRKNRHKLSGWIPQSSGTQFVAPAARGH